MTMQKLKNILAYLCGMNIGLMLMFIGLFGDQKTCSKIRLTLKEGFDNL